MLNITFAQVIKWGSEVIAGSSVLNAILPPVTMFSDYPRIQKAYKLFVGLVGWIAVNVRQYFHPQETPTKSQP